MSTALPLPTPGLPSGAPSEPSRVEVAWGRRHTLWIGSAALACCAVETVAASLARRDGPPLAQDAAHADVLVVSGTVTDKVAPQVREMYDRMATPRYVISFGACATTGGPYWDSYSVTKGVEQIVPVDVVVPGCPPRPEMLLRALELLAGREAGDSGPALVAEEDAASPEPEAPGSGTGTEASAEARTPEASTDEPAPETSGSTAEKEKP